VSPAPGTAGGTADIADRWWADRVGYQVYIRSFADSDGDGVGDLRGLHDRLDHLAWLGVGIVWITPFYPSPMHDHGYDVADYCDVEPVFGDLDAIDAVVAKAHGLGLKVVIDIVPNHSSWDHPKFVSARSSRDSPDRDLYLWRDPGPDGGLPNNWAGHFGGPAWTLDEASGQYWCHLFLPEQPDWNWRNPAVADEFDRILRFWLDRGVDGFRIDVAHSLIKHPDFPDLPPASDLHELEQEEGPVEVYEHRHLDHRHDVDQPEVLDVYRRWRDIAESYDALLLGEVYLLEADRVARYLQGDGLHLSFWFAPLHQEWDVDALRRTLVEGAAMPTGAVSWVQGSHDRMRAVTRFGGGAQGRARALALGTLLMGLPGVPFVYQGEEVGMEDGHVPPERAQDPIAVRAQDLAHSRDGCRTPMLWEAGPGWGFSTAEDAWLPYGDPSPEATVAAQRDTPGSMLDRYRALIAWRRDAGLAGVPLEWLTDDGPVIAYRRDRMVVAANCGDADAVLELPEGEWTAVVASDHARDGEVMVGTAALAVDEALVLRAGR
jgi:alpha-glucosidase